jgi:hypothetical protein
MPSAVVRPPLDGVLDGVLNGALDGPFGTSRPGDDG